MPEPACKVSPARMQHKACALDHPPVPPAALGPAYMLDRLYPLHVAHGAMAKRIGWIIGLHGPDPAGRPYA